MKAKHLCLAIPVCLLLFLAMSGMASATEINIDMDGNNYDFEVVTRMNDLTFDGFVGEANSSLTMHQTVTTQESAQWASDAPDIDRFAEFYGDGGIYARSEYNSSAQWSWGEHTTESFVESDTHGLLGQNLHFDGNWGGIKDVDQWKKQRNMNIEAEGEYELGFRAVDDRHEPSNWNFGFHASDSSSSGNLYVNTAFGSTEHGSGQWHVFDTFNVDSAFSFAGNPTINNYWTAIRGGSIQVVVDLINNIVSALGTIW